MDTKTRQSYGHRYVEKRIWQKRRHQKQRKIFFMCMLIFVGIIVISAGKKGHTKAQNVKENQVAATELAGYLQAAFLTPEETRKLVLPEVHDPLTGEDVQVVLRKLGMENSWEEFTGLLKKNSTDSQETELSKENGTDSQEVVLPKEKDADSQETELSKEKDADSQETVLSKTKEMDLQEEIIQQNLTRETWCQCYELLLEKLQVKDSVTEVEIQYLGKVPGEQRIMADNGNYDCDLQSCQMVYGKRYVVYVQENLILGIKSELTQEKDGAEKDAVNSGETENSNQENATVPITIPQTVRVLLTQDHGQKPERQAVFATGNSAWKLYTETRKAEQFFEANVISDCGAWMTEHGTSEVTAEAVDGGEICLADENGTIKERYDGVLHIYQREGETVYWVVNELGMEAYLYGVVPGEMPASFAPEALKAQAVCARTYAVMQVLGTSYEQYHADVDDTTACQVYLPENENQAATDAVNATAGQILAFQGMIASVYYFSTSCGYTTGVDVWQQEPMAYLGTQSLVLDASETGDMDAFLRNGQVTAYDSESRFFRWKAVLQTGADDGKLLQSIQNVADQRDGKVYLTDAAGVQTQDTAAFGACTGINIASRAESGCIIDLCLNFSGGTAHIYNENAIRKILWSTCASLTDKNGNSADALTMLPSAFFSIDAKENGTYEVYGGGLGHGIGMSQYGADGMAKSGMTYTEILEKFFPGTVLYKNGSE